MLLFEILKLYLSSIKQNNYWLNCTKLIAYQRDGILETLTPQIQLLTNQMKSHIEQYEIHKFLLTLFTCRYTNTMINEWPNK